MWASPSVARSPTGTKSLRADILRRPPLPPTSPSPMSSRNGDAPTDSHRNHLGCRNRQFHGDEVAAVGALEKSVTVVRAVELVDSVTRDGPVRAASAMEERVDEAQLVVGHRSLRGLSPSISRIAASKIA